MATNRIQHTPGPWKQRVCFSNGEPSEYAIESHHPEHFGIIATAHITIDNETQDEANANLIAAAPDLLETLVALVRTVASMQNTMGDPIDLLNAKRDLREAADAARAAIQKAQGGAA